MKQWVALLLVTTAWAGCLSDDDGGDDGAAAGSGGLPPAAGVATYLHDLSPVIDGLEVVTSLVEQHRIDIGEAIQLDSWIVRPPEDMVDGPVPLVLEVTPYYGGGDPVNGFGTQNAFGGLDGHAFGRMGDELVSRGYAVGIVSVRGTGNSGGCFTIGGVEEARDTAAAIEYFASQAWSNGNVGLMGVSYPGTTPQDVWVEAPPSLKTIVPISGISDLYKYNFVNGVPINIQGFGFNTYYWGTVGLGPAGLSGGNQLGDPVSVPGAVAGEACTDQAEVQEGGVSSTVDGNKDPYWQERDFLAELEASLDADPDRQRASVFYIHGLQDWNVKPHNMEDWLPAVQATGVPFKAWLGQWGHAWPAPTGSDCDEEGASCRNDWWDHVMIAWFDQFLLERDTGILDLPPVQVQDDDGVWRHEQTWPPAVAWQTLYPDASGTLTETPGAGEATYHDMAGGLLPDQVPVAQGTPLEAVFRSEPLAGDITLSGLPRFGGNVTAEGARASLMLTLAEETPAGLMRPFNFAAQSLNHVASIEAGETSIAGVQQWVELDFFPQDDVVHEGNRIVLLASGSLRTAGEPGPGLQPVSDGGEITLHLDGAWLNLPVDVTRVVEEPQPYGN
ncbi:MAG: CocE/NonD family hydrolase [Thermoplasmatota archaeon]